MKFNFETRKFEGGGSTGSVAGMKPKLALSKATKPMPGGSNFQPAVDQAPELGIQRGAFAASKPAATPNATGLNTPAAQLNPMQGRSYPKYTGSFAPGINPTTDKNFTTWQSEQSKLAMDPQYLSDFYGPEVFRTYQTSENGMSTLMNHYLDGLTKSNIPSVAAKRR
jgi:hypothetical protein